MVGRRKRKGWEQWKGAVAYALHGLSVVEEEQIRVEPVYRVWDNPPGELGGVGIQMKDGHSLSS